MLSHLAKLLCLGLLTQQALSTDKERPRLPSEITKIIQGKMAEQPENKQQHAFTAPSYNQVLQALHAGQDVISVGQVSFSISVERHGNQSIPFDINNFEEPYASSFISEVMDGGAYQYMIIYNTNARDRSGYASITIEPLNASKCSVEIVGQNYSHDYNSPYGKIIEFGDYQPVSPEDIRFACEISESRKDQLERHFLTHEFSLRSID